MNALSSEKNLFWEALAASLALHFLLFNVGNLSLRFPSRHAVEIDITNMGHLGSTGGPKPSSPPPKPAAKPKEWLRSKNPQVKPAPIPTKPVAPTPQEPSPQPAPSAGTGTGTGEGDGLVGLSRLPQLLNLADLRAILRKFYPESERAEGREGMVVVDMHVDEDGNVTSAEVVRSAGAAFDAAALRVAKLLRFSPAFLGSRRVPVKLRQAIEFKIENDG